MNLREKQVVLFRNTRAKSDKEPVMKGEIEIDGEIMEIYLWAKKTVKGDTYWSGLYKEAYQGKTESPPEGKYRKTQQQYDNNDDLPDTPF